MKGEPRHHISLRSIRRRLARRAQLPLGPLLLRIPIDVSNLLTVDLKLDNQGRVQGVLIELAAVEATRDLIIRRIVGLVLGLWGGAGEGREKKMQGGNEREEEHDMRREGGIRCVPPSRLSVRRQICSWHQSPCGSGGTRRRQRSRRRGEHYRQPQRKSLSMLAFPL